MVAHAQGILRRGAGGVLALVEVAQAPRVRGELDELRSTAESDVDNKVVPVALFGNPPLGHFLKVMHTGLKVFG